MDVNQQAGKNFAWLSVAQIGTRIFGAAFFIFLSHELKEAGLGQYSFVSSFVPFWFLLVDFGGSGYLYREWASGQKPIGDVHREFNALFTLRVIIVLLTAIPFLVVNFFINPEVYGSLVIFYVTMFLAMYSSLSDLYLQSQNRYRPIAFRQVIEKLSAVAVGFALLLLLPTVEMVFVSLLVSQLISALYYRIRVVDVRLKWEFDWREAGQLFVRGLPFMFLGIFASLYARIDMTMLRYLDNFESVGQYSAAYKFLDISYVFPSMFMASVFPLLSNLYYQNIQNASVTFHEFFLKSFRIFFSAGLLVSIGLVMFSPLIVSWFFPDSFGPTVLALRILGIGQALSYVSLLFSNLLIIERKENRGLVIIVCCAVFNVVLNFLLIPRFSLYGASWATVIAESLNLLLLYKFVAYKIETTLIAKTLGIVILNAVLLLTMKQFQLLNNVLLAACAVLTNLALLFILHVLQKQDIKLFLDPFVAKYKAFTSENPAKIS